MGEFNVKIRLAESTAAALSARRGRWSTPTSVRLPGPVLADLDAAAERRGISRSELLQRIVAGWLKEHAGEPEPEQQELGL